jgi:hypothetical protein
MAMARVLLVKLLLPLLVALAAIAAVCGQEENAAEAAAAAVVDAQGAQEAGGSGSGKGKGGLFGRVARMLDTGAAEDDDGLPIDWEAAKDEGEPVDPNRPWGASADIPDAWSVDRALQMVQRTLDGDPTGAFKDMVAATKDLQEAWANPVIFKYVVSQFSLFQAFKPLAALARKDQITAQDVSGLD